MALDYGTKAIGLALSDELGWTARPLTTLRREKLNLTQLLEQLVTLLAEHEVGTLVIGLPLNMDGSHGPAAARVESFVALLKQQTDVPVVLLDERLTSYEADQMLRELGIGPRERRAKSDEYAALLILRDYLASRTSHNEAVTTPSTETNP